MIFIFLKMDTLTRGIEYFAHSVVLQFMVQRLYENIPLVKETVVQALLADFTNNFKEVRDINNVLYVCMHSAGLLKPNTNINDIITKLGGYRRIVEYIYKYVTNYYSNMSDYKIWESKAHEIYDNKNYSVTDGTVHLL